jgi:hypothetical protein
MQVSGDREANSLRAGEFSTHNKKILDRYAPVEYFNSTNTRQ